MVSHAAAGAWLRRNIWTTTIRNGGFPVSDDCRLFEKLCLEGFQAGLSWRTILSKRENFRAAFHEFDFNGIARFTQRDINCLLKNEGIIRHRGKIEAVVNNAQRVQELVRREGSLAAFIWRYEPDAKQRAKPQTASTSAESIALSRDLKKLGWKVVGPTTVYAFMQAMGLINDHVDVVAYGQKSRRSVSGSQSPWADTKSGCQPWLIAERLHFASNETMTPRVFILPTSLNPRC